MKTFIFNKETLIDNKFKIQEFELNHLKNVMRLKVDDQIVGVCYDDYNYIAKIVEITKSYALCEVIEKQINICNPKKSLTVFQALLRNENLNFCVQKLTELGVSTFIPFQSEFCTAKKTDMKHKKLQEISNQSLKQCGRSKPIDVKPAITFNYMLTEIKNYDVVVFANETEKNTNILELDLKNYISIAIIIGCEGGFSPKEIEALKQLDNIISVSLGKRILRAETASLALSTLVLNKIGEI